MSEKKEDSLGSSAEFRYLSAIGKARGFVTYDEVNDNMPASVVSEEDIGVWLEGLARQGIEIVETFERSGDGDDEEPG